MIAKPSTYITRLPILHSVLMAGGMTFSALRGSKNQVLGFNLGSLTIDRVYLFPKIHKEHRTDGRHDTLRPTKVWTFDSDCASNFFLLRMVRSPWVVDLLDHDKPLRSSCFRACSFSREARRFLRENGSEHAIHQVFCSTLHTSHRQKWISRFSGQSQRAASTEQSHLRALGLCDRDGIFRQLRAGAGWRSMIPFSKKKMRQRRGFASWLSHFGTGKPTASAEDMHWQRVRLLQRLG